MQTDLGEPASSNVVRAEYVFELYIVEEETRHQEIRDSVRELFDQHLKNQYQLRVVNVARHPEKANRADVLATPTLIKLHPQPAQRVVGDLIVGDCLLEEFGIAYQ